MKISCILFFQYAICSNDIHASKCFSVRFRVARSTEKRVCKNMSLIDESVAESNGN